MSEMAFAILCAWAVWASGVFAARRIWAMSRKEMGAEAILCAAVCSWGSAAVWFLCWLFLRDKGEAK